MGEFRKLLYPFAVLFGLVIRLRHFLYNKHILKSVTYDFPIICVGNLSVGGTGKSPMTEYLIRLLQSNYRVGVLSRGYKRKTAGYLLAGVSVDASTIGDEPYQYFKKFKEIKVAVAEKRAYGIKRLRRDTDTEVIILDDAFQHRSVNAGLNLLLSSYHNLFTDDYLLPAGNLRDLKSRANAADIIVVTKCPESLTEEGKTQVIKKIRRYTLQPIYFTCIKYGEVLLNNKTQITVESLGKKSFTLVTGIAKPLPLVNHLKSKGYTFDHISFADHHIFTSKELEVLKKKTLVITTEKDFSRLEKHLPDCFYIAIEPQFIDGNATDFDNAILNYAKK